MKYNNLKDAFFDSKFHVGKGMATYDAELNAATFNNLLTIDSVVNNQTAIDDIIASQKSVDAIVNSGIAISSVAKSDVARVAFQDANIINDFTGSPGGVNLIGGDMSAGYLGTVPASELFTGTELASAVGITQGTVQFNEEEWLKFVIDGKIIFKSKKPFRHSISWDHINSQGCVNGTKTVTKNGVTYKVRLMKGGNGNASDLVNGPKKSEWNKLMLPIHVKAKDQSWAYANNVDTPTPYWGIDFTDADLLTHNSHGSGSYHWCQEVFHSNASNRVCRGNVGVSSSGNATSSNASAGLGWSPCLEVVS